MLGGAGAKPALNLDTDGAVPRARLAWMSLAVIAYLASRVPLLGLGFGSDSDAWSVGAVAIGIVREGHYQVSRAPGHPVHETLYAIPMALGGPLWSNALTLMLSLGVLIVTARLGRALGVSRPYWAAGLLAVHPLFWITSADSTDFTLAALLGAGSLLAGRTGSWRWAGILLGLGVGTRIELAVFAFPLVMLSGDPAWWRTLAVAAFTSAACYLPVLLAYGDTPWFLGDLYTSVHEPTSRATSFAASLWAASGLVPGLAVAGALFAGRKAVMSLARRKDPLWKAISSLAGAYLIVTLVHPGKPAYYVPLLPLAILSLIQVAPAACRVAILGAFLSYGFVYPDVIDRIGSSVSVGFRWNNGLVVKDWVGRWNANEAAARLDRNRPEECDLMVLGYWLPVWRWSHLDATPIPALAPEVQIDPRTNAAFVDRRGVGTVHKLSPSASATLHRGGMTMCYGEGIDGFLQEAYGYDIRAFGATEIRTRDLGYEVSERFTLPMLLWCGRAKGSWRECVRSQLG